MKVESLCCTSIENAKGSLQFIDDLKFLKKALLYETCHMRRATMIKMLKAKIKRVKNAS
jgi:hypothetical protein